MNRSQNDPALELGSPLAVLRGVGPARERALAERGFHNLEDLLFHLPLRYEDRRTLSTTADLVTPGPYTVLGRLHSIKRVRVRRRGFSIVRGKLEDDFGQIPVVWFNRPYLPNQVEEGTEYLLCGELRERGGGLELMNAACERPDRARVTRGVVPVYPALPGVSRAVLRGLLEQVIGLAESVPEYLPRTLLEAHDLPSLGPALVALHSPDDEADVDALNERGGPAHRRLIYGEFLDQQVGLSLSRADARSSLKRHRYSSVYRLTEICTTLPPFELTSAQKRSVDEILGDLVGPKPMLRLLQGDVGCGKTIVAALALSFAAESGLQAALMAPTELLAEQHARSLEPLLPKQWRPLLLTGSSEEPQALRDRIASGEARIVIGTQALIQEKVQFEKLGLVVVDEQHRFGVSQRRALGAKGRFPDLLVMTATPIPRSLALAVYGDLDLSVIDEMPPGRTPVETRVVDRSKRNRVYGWLERRLEKGSQAYVVLPLIDDSEKLDSASIERHGQELMRRFSEFRPAVLHGRTAPEDRRRILHDFGTGKIRVLIATTVIEVGLDIDSAEIMVIESSERFGLSQLHQLRGRVGRGSAASYCVAIHGSRTEEAVARLQAFAESSDGFRLAEADMEIRGPGDLLGTRQAGMPTFRLANLYRDRELLESARRDARELIASRDRATPLFWKRIERRGGGGERLTGG